MKDLSHLPKPEPDEGLVPSPDVRFGDAIARREQQRPDKPIALGTPFRYSDAAKCARYLSYTLRDDVEREPIDAAGLQVMRTGTLLHEDWQAALAEEYGEDIAFEVATKIDDIISGSCDATMPGTVVELKTCGGFKFKMMIGDRGIAQGPSAPNIVQLALNVVGNDAEEGVLVYIATEAISKGQADRKGYTEEQRFSAEWTFTREELEPYATKEVARLKHILSMHEKGELAPRHVPYEMPPGTRITDPVKSMWVDTDEDGNVVDTGTIWGGQFCTYCPFTEQCIKDGA